MEDHEKNLLLLIVIGASIGFAKAASVEKLTLALNDRPYHSFGCRNINNSRCHHSANSLLILVFKHQLWGFSFIENWLKSQSMKWGGKY